MRLALALSAFDLVSPDRVPATLIDAARNAHTVADKGAKTGLDATDSSPKARMLDLWL